MWENTGICKSTAGMVSGSGSFNTSKHTLSRRGLLLNATTAAFHLKALHPRQSGWSQWHASAVTFFESWQIWLQYFCLSGAIQLQAGCAHFFVPAIPILLTVTSRLFHKGRDMTDVVTQKSWDRVSCFTTFSRELHQGSGNPARILKTGAASVSYGAGQFSDQISLERWGAGPARTPLNSLLQGAESRTSFQQSPSKTTPRAYRLNRT